MLVNKESENRKGLARIYSEMIPMCRVIRTDERSVGE